MRYAFIAEHRPIFAVRAMCRMLLVHPSGFYAWLREPFCHRALEDQRQTVLLKQAWDDSGEVYGYRKPHDDLCDLGEDISPDRAWRLARLAGIRAQIGYKKKPGSYGGSPAIVADNALNREFDVDAPDQFCLSAIEDNRLPVPGHRHHLHPHPRRLPVSCPSTLGLNQWRSNVPMIDLFSRRVVGPLSRFAGKPLPAARQHMRSMCERGATGPCKAAPTRTCRSKHCSLSRFAGQTVAGQCMAVWPCRIGWKSL